MLADAPSLMPIAGATDVLVHWPVNLKARQRDYLDLSRLDALRPLRWSDDALTLGALTTYWDVIRDERCAKEFPLLVDAADIHRHPPDARPDADGVEPKPSIADGQPCRGEIGREVVHCFVHALMTPVIGCVFVEPRFACGDAISVLQVRFKMLRVLAV